MSVQPIEHSSTAPNQLAYGANGRRATQDATSERTTSKGGCSPHRERKNDAAQFPADAASSAEGLG